jgi:hypothetical protein
MGWGEAIGKIFDWIPGRRETYRNQIENVKREIYVLQSKRPFTDADSDKYVKLASKLRQLEEKAKNG